MFENSRLQSEATIFCSFTRKCFDIHEQNFFFPMLALSFSEYWSIHWFLLVWFGYNVCCVITTRKVVWIRFERHKGEFWALNQELQLWFHLLLFQMCVPFYGSNNFKLLAYCLFYFIPTLVLMLCYGNVFHSKHMQEMRRAAKSVSNNYALMNGGKSVNMEATSQYG